MTMQLEDRLAKADAQPLAKEAPSATAANPQTVVAALQRAAALQTRRLIQEDRQGDRYEASALDKTVGPAAEAKPLAPSDSEQTWKLLDQAAASRKQALKNLGTPRKAKPADRVMPEDGSYRVEVFHVGVGGEAHDLVMLEELLEIARIEGFRIIAYAVHSLHPKIEERMPSSLRGRLQLTDLKASSAGWIEDYGELTAAGGVHIPATVADDPLLINSQRQARGESLLPVKYGQLACTSKEQCNDSKLQYEGAVDKRGERDVLAGFAAKSGRALTQDLTYGEGGNRLVGTLPNGEGYALVGRETIAISRALLTRDLGRPVSAAETLEATARDLGIDAKNVIEVEQPGEYHLDVAVMLLHGGVAVLNDARAAAELTIKWLRENGKHDAANERRIRSAANVRAQMEDKTAADMSKHGITVYRVAGVFPDMQPEMNFLNVESGIGASGRSFMVALGGDPRAEQYISEKIAAAPGGPERIYLLSPQVGAGLLKLFGGINCRVKGEGKIVR